MKALIPLRWCEYKACETFSCRRVEGMALCEVHAAYVEKMIEDSGVELVRDVPQVAVKKIGAA